MSNQYAYQGPLGEVVDNGQHFFAWREGVLIGKEYKTLEEALEALASIKRLKTDEE